MAYAVFIEGVFPGRGGQIGGAIRTSARVGKECLLQLIDGRAVDFPSRRAARRPAPAK